MGQKPIDIEQKAEHRLIVQMLLSKGADCNIRRHDGQLPIDIAIDKGYGNIEEILKNLNT